MYTAQDFMVSKDILFSGGGFTHVCYDSLTNGHNKYWESKNALKMCKAYAKENGFARVIVIPKTWRSKNIVYEL